MDKQKAITEAGESISNALVEIMRLPGITDLAAIQRQVMNSVQLEMFELAQLCETEMLKTYEAGAYFSSCLMGAAMNEALLALMCLIFEADVRNTRQYHHSTKKRQDLEYREVVSNWSFEQFIRVAEECNWIPSSVVQEDLIVALADGFRELMPMTHPELSEDDIEKGAQAFFSQPGSSILRMAQNLRNSIHAGSWMRRRSTFDAQAFEGWCKFAVHLCGEIRLCLMHQVMTRVGQVANAQLVKLQELIAQLPPEAIPFIEQEARRVLMCPTLVIADFEKIVSAMMTAAPKS